MHEHVLAVGSAAVGAIAGWLLGRSQRFSEARHVLNGNNRWMTEQDLWIAGGLIAAGHGHLLSHWPESGTNDQQKRDLMVMVLLSIRHLSRDLEKFRIALIRPPQPQKSPSFLTAHGDVRDDPYYWMRDIFRNNPLVLSHLKAENACVRAMLADTSCLQNSLYSEMQSRTEKEDISPPLRVRNYYYYSKRPVGKKFAIHYRRKIRENTPPQLATETMDVSMAEEILLDENRESKRHAFYSVSELRVAPNEQLLAYCQDVKGARFFALKIKEISNGRQLLKKEIRNTGDECEWSADSSAVFYLTLDAMGRPNKVWRHEVTSGADQDVCVYAEDGTEFSTHLKKTRDLSTICIMSDSKSTMECLTIDAQHPRGELKVVLPRRDDVYYWLEHYNESFLFCIRDQDRPNSEITIASVHTPQKQSVLIPHQTDCRIEDFVISRRFLTVFSRKSGLQSAFVYILPHDIETARELGDPVKLPFEEAVLSLKPGPQGDFDSEVLRLIFSSLVTPTSIIDQHLGTYERSVKKMERPQEYDQTEYRTERAWALAIDGVRVPISLVYRIDAVRHDGTDPLLMHVYGAYEHCLNPTFSPDSLSLLRHGVVYAIAHVRGGGEMGREWYEHGRLSRKRTTFTDIIACARHLIERMYCSPSKLCLYGEGAGGLAVAAVMNMAPELFCAAVLHSPFVDVLTTMRDSNECTMAGEWAEWGDHRDKQDYRYMKSYSPMDNIKHQSYPHMLLTAGYRDLDYGYWEAAKFTAKIRDHKTNSSMVLFQCDFERRRSLHSTARQQRRAALEYAFLLKSVGHLPVELPETERL